MGTIELQFVSKKEARILLRAGSLSLENLISLALLVLGGYPTPLLLCCAAHKSPDPTVPFLAASQGEDVSGTIKRLFLENRLTHVQTSLLLRKFIWKHRSLMPAGGPPTLEEYIIKRYGENERGIIEGFKLVYPFVEILWHEALQTSPV